MRCWTLSVVVLFIGCAAARGKPLPAAASALHAIAAHDDDWFNTEDGKRAIDNIISWQNQNGGWWKFYDPTIPRPSVLPEPSDANGPAGDTEAEWRRTSTFDNGATYTELRLLARAYRITKNEAARKSFDRGLAFIYQAQYQNGGWPQRYPVEKDNYGHHITFNDDAMTNVMHLLRDIAAGERDFTFVKEDERQRARESFARGIDCILNCQIIAHGKLTGWCQQHDAETLAPAKGRAYELPSISGGESGDIVMLLMKIPNPDRRVCEAIESAVAWYESAKITGIRIEKVEGPQYENGRDKIIVNHPAAAPLFARFYDIKTNKPIFVDRSGIPRATLAEISWERRNNYAYYGQWGNDVYREYPKWKQRTAVTAGQSAAASRAVTVAQDGSGNFKTVREAINSTDGSNIIHIKPGVYKERITIPKSKPGITLIGDDPAKTILTFDLLATAIKPGTTQPIGTSGTPSTSIDADNFTARNITFENSAGDNGQAVAVKVTGDRAAFYNCRFLGWQDTLYAESGRQYYRDCYIEGRVDFIFGGATAVFDHCTIHSKNGGYITAARTFPDQKFGYVFLDCTLTGEGGPAYLGRPWQWDRGRSASVAFVRTKMGPHIRAEGWNQWDRPNNPNTNPAATARYSEFASTDSSGQPIDVSKRVPWSHQLTAEQAGELTIEKIFGDWNPAAGPGEKQ